MSKTELQKVQERIRDLTGKKSADLETIREKQAEAQAQMEAAERAIKEATESMNVDAYEEAMQAKSKAQTAYDMYATRYAQIDQKDFVTEEESTNVLASLVAYNGKLAETFKTELAEHLKALKALADNYTASVSETEQTLNVWQRDIRANYISDTMLRADGSRRSQQPIRIHAFSCEEAQRLKTYLNMAAADFAE